MREVEGRREGGGKGRKRGGLCRACELSSGRRRHWKNRTEINRSVFFAELEHHGLSLSLVLSRFSRRSVVPLSLPTDSPRFLPPPCLDLPLSLFLSLPPTPLTLAISLPALSFSFSSASLPFRLRFSYPRLPSFLSQAPGVYSVIARPVQDDCVGLSTSIARLPPYSAFSAVNILSHYISIASAPDVAAVVRVVPYIISNWLYDFIDILSSYAIHALFLVYLSLTRVSV